MILGYILTAFGWFLIGGVAADNRADDKVMNRMLITSSVSVIIGALCFYFK